MALTVPAANAFFTADTHFFHHGIIDACKRPFQNTGHMHAVMIGRWNHVVGVNDLVFHLGDVAFANTANTLGILGQLNGRIILIRGNHDKKLAAAVRARFTAIHDFLEIDVEEAPAVKQRISLMHYALRTWNRHHYGAWQLHGHSHGSLQPIGRQIDVGVDCHDFKPISYFDIKTALLDRPIHSVDHHMAPT